MTLFTDSEQSIRSLPLVPNLGDDNTDIFLIFNLHGFYITLRDLAPIRDKSIILRLSDLWWLTDHCAFPGDCAEFLGGCLRCPNLQNYPPVFRNQKGNNRLLKRTFIQETCPTVVCPSDYSYDIFNDSGLARFCRKVVVIPSSADENIFYPREEFSNTMRNNNGLVALFVADGGLENLRKGGIALREFIKSKCEKNVGSINGKSMLTILVVGGEERGDSFYSCGSTILKISEIGRKRHEEMGDIYRAVDFTLLNAWEDNLPNCGVESMACGTPLVLRTVRGLAQLIHKDCIVYDQLSLDFMERVINIWSASSVLKCASNSARSHYEKNFSKEREAKQWSELIHDSIR